MDTHLARFCPAVHLAESRWLSQCSSSVLNFNNASVFHSQPQNNRALMQRGTLANHSKRGLETIPWFKALQNTAALKTRRHSEGRTKREGERRRAGTRQRGGDGQGGREAKTNSLVTDLVWRRWKWASFPCTLQEAHAAEGGHTWMHSEPSVVCYLTPLQQSARKGCAIYVFLSSVYLVIPTLAAIILHFCILPKKVCNL